MKKCSEDKIKNIKSKSSEMIKYKTDQINYLLECNILKINYPKYIIYDFETDTSSGIHLPNHVEIDILQIDKDQTHDYDKCLINKFGINGYDCNNEFCEWLFTEKIKILL